MVDLEKVNRRSIGNVAYNIKAKKKYWADVWRLTEEVAHLIPGVENRGFNDFHIDHIFPIYYGFKQGVPPEDIANLANLRMLPKEENLKKSKNRLTESFIKLQSIA